MLAGFYLNLGDTVDESVSRRVLSLTRTIMKNPHPSLTDVIPGYTTLYLEYDTTRASKQTLRRWLARLPTTSLPATPEAGQTVQIPVTYDGPDLESVAVSTGLTPAEIVQRHSGASYHVFATGFTPGLAFMGPLEPALHVPRRNEPRPCVEAGSVAIAQTQTTVYPVLSPGGWNLLGRAHRQIYDPLRDEPLLLHAAARVRFVPSEAEPPPQTENILNLLPGEPARPLLRVVEAGLLDIVIDRGRFWSGRFGFARSGPLDPLAAARANRLVGNPAHAPLLELNVRGSTFEACSSGVVGVCGGLGAVLNGARLAPDSSFALHPGDRLSFAPLSRGCRAYLALAGGLETHTFRGSASTDGRGRIGRPLRMGDMLGTASVRDVRAGCTFAPYTAPDMPLRLLPGPQASEEALGALTRQVFEVGRADRMGMTLLGATVPGGEIISEAVPLGSVQVPPGGTPMLLLNDRGTLGGYAKPAVLHPYDLHRAAQLRPGAQVRFRLAL